MRLLFRFRVRTIILFVISIFIVAFSSNYKSATELIYTNVINRFIREKLSFLSGQIAFPIGDILTIVFIVAFVYCMVTLIKKLLNTANIFNFLYKLFWMLVNTFSIVFFMYIILFGLNYHTPELSDVLIDKYNNKYATNVRVDVDNEKRVEVYNILVEKIKETRVLAKSKDNRFTTANILGASEQVQEGFRAISDTFPVLAGEYSNAKVSLKSPVFSFFGLDARHYILTNEISLNKSIPSEYLPFVIAKYMSYQRGVAREDEAVFYAYMACINNSDPRVQYSGYLAALDHIVSTLRVYDKIDYNNLIVSLDPEIRKDLNKIESYRSRYSYGANAKDQFMNKFKRLNGDIRVEDLNYQVTSLISTYYSLFTY